MKCLILLLALGACAPLPTATEPDDCVPPGPEAPWCRHLDGDVAVDSLLTLPPDSSSHLGAPGAADEGGE